MWFKRIYIYSSYKSCRTVKTLIAVTLNGIISFPSTFYGGRTSSDSFILWVLGKVRA